MKKMAEKAPFMIAHEFQAVHRCGPVLTMDSSRVILKRYMPSQRAIAIRVIKQVLALKEAVVRQSLEDVLNNYADRHRPAFVKNFARMRFHELRGLLTTPPPPRAAQEARETQVAGVPASEKSPVAAFAQAAIEERLIRRGARLSDNDENSIPNEDIVLPKNLAVRPQDKTSYPPPSTGEVTKGTGTVAAPSPAMSLSSSDSQRRAEEKPLSARAREEELARLNDEVMSPVDFGLCDAAHSEAGVCPRPLSEARKLLIGVYFLHEYSIESAALFNPSVVPHWDQAGVPEGSLRFILSMRATGEGHISSIEFRTGIFHPFVKPQGRIQMDLPRKPIMAALLDHTFTGEEEAAARGKIDAARQELRARRTLPFLSPCAGGGGLSVETHALSPGGSSASGGLNPETHPLLSPVASTAAAEAARYHTSELTTPGVSHHQLQNPRNPDCFRVVAPQDMGVDQRVIFPVTPSQSNGLEDARFVLFCDDDGSARYYATFTAYDGRAIEPQLLETTDFCSFIFRRLRGDIFNKGMALFPRKIQGKYWMLSRQDDENVLVMSSDDILEWKDPTVIARPEQIWEMFKMGNCGSPIETDQGWIVLTHGVGPLRAYGIGAILLDLNDPTKVIGRLKEPIVAPNEFEREGYVPNVVYTCGAMAYGGMLLVPYATSDTTSSFATVRLEVLVGALLKSGPGGEPPVLSQRATTITSQH